MSRLFSLAALGTLILLVSTADAARVPSSKAITLPSIAPGRVDVTVPYTTNGRSTLGVYQGVSPYIYAYPALTDPINHGGVGVYNLPFYGGKQALSSNNPGATPGNTALQPRRRR
jgi:hypothetical protein